MNANEVVVFVPTRGNKKLLLNMANQLRSVRKVYFLATQVKVEEDELPPNAKVLYGGERYQKRKHAVHLAADLGLPYCIMIDDDLTSKTMPETAATLADTLAAYPFLGTVCAQSRMSLGMSWLSTPYSHPFVLKNFSACFFAINVKAYGQVPGFRASVFDDLDLGAQMWNIGYANAAIERSFDYKRKTGNQDPSQGGMPSAEYEAGVRAGLEALRTMPDILPVVDAVIRDGHTRQKLKWNWDRMLANLRHRFPGLSYADSKIAFMGVSDGNLAN